MHRMALRQAATRGREGRGGAGERLIKDLKRQVNWERLIKDVKTEDNSLSRGSEQASTLRAGNGAPFPPILKRGGGGVRES